MAADQGRGGSMKVPCSVNANEDYREIWIATYAAYSAQLQLRYQLADSSPLTEAMSNHIRLCAAAAADEACKGI